MGWPTCATLDRQLGAVCMLLLMAEIHGINYQPQLVIAGFLNHQQYHLENWKKQLCRSSSLNSPMHPFWKAWLKPQLWTFVVLWNIMELYTKNHQDGRLVQISHRSTKEDIFSLTLTLRSVFLSQIFSCGSSWFTMVQSLDWFGRIGSLFVHLSYKNYLLSSAEHWVNWVRPHMPRYTTCTPQGSLGLYEDIWYILVFTNQGPQLHQVCVDAWLQVGSVLLICGDGWSKRPGNPRKPPPSPIFVNLSLRWPLP